MTKLKGKAKQKARAKAKQAEQKTTGLKHLENLAKIGADLMNRHPSGEIPFAHLKPFKIITDTKERYEAVFKDDMGEYDFSIEHKKDGYHVMASGIPRGPFASIDKVLWEFEVQLSTHGPKVLQGRTYQGQGSFSWEAMDFINNLKVDLT